MRTAYDKMLRKEFKGVSKDLSVAALNKTIEAIEEIPWLPHQALDPYRTRYNSYYIRLWTLVE